MYGLATFARALSCKLSRSPTVQVASRQEALSVAHEPMSVVQSPNSYLSSGFRNTHEPPSVPTRLLNLLKIDKEDLALPNHLAGLKKTYLQLKFDNTRHLMDVRKVNPLQLLGRALSRTPSSGSESEAKLYRCCVEVPAHV